MAFRDVNARRHIGLQQLSSLASTGRTFLGPMKSHKFIVDESTNQSRLIFSAVRLIESLDLTSAVGQLLHETIQAQNKEFKTGMSTLLFLVGAWSNAVVECLQQNVPVPAIVSVMSEGLNSCCERVQCLQIPIHDVKKELCSSRVRPKAFESRTGQVGRDSLTHPWNLLCFQRDISATEVIPINSCSHQGDDCNFNKCLVSPLAGFGSAASVVKAVSDKSSSALSGSGVTASSCITRKLTHSRHFSALGKSHFSSQQDNFQGYLSGPRADPCGCRGLGHLAMALSHGNQSSVKLLQSIAAYQQERAECSGSSQINIAEIVTCCVLGLPESYSCVSPGFVTLVSPEQATVIKHLADKPLRILLMDGDLTEQYRHLGFNRPRNVRTVLEHPNPQGGRAGDLWLSRMSDILMSFEVNLVLVKGSVCKNFMERCIASRILVIGCVSRDVLCAFGAATGAQAVTYLSQLNASRIGNGAWVELWAASDGRAVDLGELVPARISAGGIALLTAVLTTALPSKAQLLEDQFWTLLYRLHHALKDGRVFPGGGAVELLCLSHIQALEGQPGRPGNDRVVTEFPSPWLAEYKSVVLQALASGWKRYLAVVLCNTAKASSELEAGALVDHHLQKAAACGSSSAYILEEFRRGGVLRGGCDPFPDQFTDLKVCDNVAAKTEAWRRALDLVLLVLQTDAEIITGPRRNQILNSSVSNKFMFL
ncbi:Bardet-Biedl syndrome 12 protein [Cyanistes caeruleus]|uniref:Bardet-Biedl syndrome 12 n=1 Tax=Cyanistes caeruleus TaxID=156563 RepID=A0A8C0VWH1_CYACU|nr:Bardet-Biedl syndrome 12 protein [Cyanistes caeruleus]XP_023782310.1 Bardet-Biedl syndrome 12 protein [Cyanistes caeruleus]XP_023782311.1 Bardet-Biedl syndrome 12 protein [Cyanistes caeruleus]XP_023782312.1 Bardet-Biedl syndrome 12 protein [Cyanistes caeruleus]XP_023782313.1 Bardet-Biedl syndrome 12 protein [Cyanistes caeruleus]XP_023782314.1 Bardet-Biedl syndrome 12 protein [Cyanistes caeruleus]XP_023782315.1 Bardet-Biedl syndrome 12 protein [Cyanistes caeruleus]XP_023782316.1 Bardet-Bie